MSHSNDTLIHRLFDTYRSGDRDASARFFAVDALFRYAGPGPLHGDYRGRKALVHFWAEQDRSSGAVFMPEMVDLVAGDRNVFLLVRITPPHGPSWLRVVVFEIEKGLISGAHVFEEDPAAAEVFFSQGAPGA